MVTTTVHRPKHIGRIIKNRESELTHALLKTRLACRSVVLPVKMSVGHCPALGAFFFAQIGSAMSFLITARLFRGERPFSFVTTARAVCTTAYGRLVLIFADEFCSFRVQLEPFATDTVRASVTPGREWSENGCYRQRHGTVKRSRTSFVGARAPRCLGSHGVSIETTGQIVMVTVSV